MTAENTEAKSISSRRTFLGNVALVAAASAILQARTFLSSRGWIEAAQTASTDLVHDTFNGLLAFVVPGPDEYSVSQGVSTAEPGGVAAGGADVLIVTLDQSTPFLPQFSSTVVAVLNGLAQIVNPSTAGAFISPFARLAFAEKVAVFQIMDATESLKPLAALLPALTAAFSYSEAGVFDPATRSLTGAPIGWQISTYQGIADGRDEFLGYFDKR
jgi:hypothetical protein